MKLDEPPAKDTEGGEGTTITGEELISGEGIDVDAVTLAFPINVDVWFMLVED